VLSVQWKKRDPDAGRDEQFVLQNSIRLPQRDKVTLHLTGRRDGKFIAAHPAREIAFTQQASQTLGRNFQ
jgi:hypothetical protein